MTDDKAHEQALAEIERLKIQVKTLEQRIQAIERVFQDKRAFSDMVVGAINLHNRNR